MTRTSRYWVWRRSDGYVGCNNGLAPVDTRIDTFEILFDTEDWNEARIKIEDERTDPRHRALVAGWDEPVPCLHELTPVEAAKVGYCHPCADSLGVFCECRREWRAEG